MGTSPEESLKQVRWLSRKLTVAFSFCTPPAAMGRGGGIPAWATLVLRQWLRPFWGLSLFPRPWESLSYEVKNAQKGLNRMFFNQTKQDRMQISRESSSSNSLIHTSFWKNPTGSSLVICFYIVRGFEEEDSLENFVLFWLKIAPFNLLCVLDLSERRQSTLFQIFFPHRTSFTYWQEFCLVYFWFSGLFDFIFPIALI